MVYWASQTHSEPYDGLRGSGNDRSEDLWPKRTGTEVTGRIVVMLSLLLDDGRDGKNGRLIAAVQYGELMFEMPEYNALNRDGSGRNGICPKQARNGAEYKPTNAAEPVATATRLSATLQLSTKSGSVP